MADVLALLFERRLGNIRTGYATASAKGELNWRNLSSLQPTIIIMTFPFSFYPDSLNSITFVHGSK